MSHGQLIFFARLLQSRLTISPLLFNRSSFFSFWLVFSWRVRLRSRYYVARANATFQWISFGWFSKTYVDNFLCWMNFEIIPILMIYIIWRMPFFWYSYFCVAMTFLIAFVYILTSFFSVDHLVSRSRQSRAAVWNAFQVEKRRKVNLSIRNCVCVENQLSSDGT